MKKQQKYGIIACYSSSAPGNDLMKLFIQTENVDLNYIWDTALGNQNKFPDGQLIEIKIIPLADITEE